MHDNRKYTFLRIRPILLLGLVVIVILGFVNNIDSMIFLGIVILIISTMQYKRSICANYTDLKKNLTELKWVGLSSIHFLDGYEKARKWNRETLLLMKAVSQSMIDRWNFSSTALSIVALFVAVVSIYMQIHGIAIPAIPMENIAVAEAINQMVNTWVRVFAIAIVTGLVAAVSSIVTHFSRHRAIIAICEAHLARKVDAQQDE